jgi:plastocyanin
VRKRTTAVLAAAMTVCAIAALPVLAATPKFTGNVGPGFTISMAKKPTKAGTINLVVNDKSSIHNFRLKGPGVNVKTTVAFTGTKTFKNLTLKKGKYTFVCDPHLTSMKGSFTIK